MTKSEMKSFKGAVLLLLLLLLLLLFLRLFIKGRKAVWNLKWRSDTMAEKFPTTSVGFYQNYGFACTLSTSLPLTLVILY